MTRPLAIAFVIALLAALYFGAQWQKQRDAAKTMEAKTIILKTQADSLNKALSTSEMNASMWKDSAKKSALETERLKATRQIIIHDHVKATERVNTADADALLDILAGPISNADRTAGADSSRARH